ncbi:MAG: hypothetical protein J6C96_04185 [Oscillospiraceae bacterium]|nr:hypothetical protein [Oscillospiraceae bacterium]
MTNDYFNNSIKLITNDRCGNEDYTDWANEAEFMLLKNYCLLNSRHKASFSSDDCLLGEEYLRSISERNNAWSLLSGFKNADKVERLAMNDDVNNIEEVLYEYSRSQIVCKDNQLTDV